MTLHLRRIDKFLFNDRVVSVYEPNWLGRVLREEEGAVKVEWPSGVRTWERAESLERR